VYYAILLAAAIVVLVLSPVEDRNKPLDEIEHKVYKGRVIFITAAELMIGLALKLVRLDNLFVIVVYSFLALSVMLITGKIKNCWLIENSRG